MGPKATPWPLSPAGGQAPCLCTTFGPPPSLSGALQNAFTSCWTLGSVSQELVHSLGQPDFSTFFYDLFGGG